MNPHLYPVADDGIRQGEHASTVSVIPVEVPEPPTKLSAKETKVWRHVTGALRDCGLIHRTDAMLLAVICRTFVRWADAEEQLNALIKSNGGTWIVKTPNGYEQPHQLFYLTRTLKRELLQWLPEAALTIPSFQKVAGERATPEQGSLFGEDPVEQHRRRKTAIGMRPV